MAKSGREISITIGTSCRAWEEATESWILQQINARRNDRAPVCVRLSIKTDSVNIKLSTKDCPEVSGGGRAPTVQEQRVFDLWKKLGLNEKNFQDSILVAFLKQVG